MENSPEMWSAYGGPGGQDTKVGIEVRFSVLRRLVNEAVQAILETETGPTPHWLQLFSVNYGRVQHGDWRDMKLASDIFPNPVVPVFWKDGQRYGSEKELRIALSAIGIGQPLMGAARTFEFPKGLSYPFDLRAALMGGSMALRLDQPTALDRLRRITEKAGFSLGMRQDSGAQGKP
ncbi:hypothetical protein [Tabrizicola fusiformis]|uniref:hypothetical protein n=1 Tax=Tabrizicola sp. SY72 TaxID=2741673 RepID=UPI00157332EE|nr:hypothetical protein [Tabrizicola sp. SY72]NTT85756.1 hypothetical protein [Tabrizicola sp. SY72]